jgi:membrane protease YdiL (CAAX protease family)
LGDYGVKLKGVFSLWWMYILMLAVMLPIVIVASRSEGFQATYPFFEPFPNEPLWPRFWIWEVAYFLQFVGLEFFFRGFLLHGIRRRFGAYAIFVMMVPYCMIHFGKPIPETLAAIVAGIILGFMSLKTRSIWMGAALHVTVALTMDTCALWRVGKFF